MTEPVAEPATPTRLDDFLVRDPVVLEVGSTPEEATGRLGRSGHGVVLTDSGKVLSVVAAEDLARIARSRVRRLSDRRAALPPAVVLRFGTPLAVFAGDDAITLLDLVPNITTVAVVDDDDRLIGLFPLAVLDRYLSEGGSVASGDVLGAGGYGGNGQAVGRIRIGLARVVCAECGEVNELVPPIDSDYPGLCANAAGTPHRLRIAIVGPDD